MRILAFVLAGGLYGQSFEVASVRQNKIFSCQGRWDFRVSHGTVTAENAPLRRIISRAFHMTDDRVTGPAWLDSECYDIRAKASGTVADPDLLKMLQRLLADRFRMDAHLESEERPVLALVVDKGGSKLRAFSGAPAPPTSFPEGRVLFMVRHMPDLCERIGKVMGRPVVDKTGLTGDYSIVLTYLPLGADSSDGGADIRSAVREQLGLRVEPQRGAVEILKIDSIEKVPTAN